MKDLLTVKESDVRSYKEDFKDFTLHELNEEAIKIGLGLIDQYGNEWASVLATNRKHIAIMELIKEKKDG